MTENVKLKLPVHKSLLGKVAIFTFGMFFLSLMVYMYATYRSFSASYDWIKSEDLSSSVKSYMLSLKEIDNREREKIARQIELNFKKKNSGSELSKFNIDYISSLFGEKISNKIIFDKENISQLTSFITRGQINPKVEWLSRSTLRVLNYSIDIKSNSIEQKYREAEFKLRKIKLFENKMVNDLVNGLFKISGLVCIIYFLIVVVIFLRQGQKFTKRISDFHNGLKKWSFGDFQHRENISVVDELGIIQSYFNEMAFEIEKGRKKTIDLEKISHWQTIAKKMAHEVKNPLTPIQLIFSNIKRNYKGDDKVFEKKLSDSYKMILNEVAGLRRLVDSFTEFSSLPIAKPERENLTCTLKEVVKKYKALEHPHEILLENHTSDEDLWWIHDKGLISQVVSNLIKNSIEACGRSPSQILVELKKPSKDNVQINVVDNGPGIPDEIQKNVFEPHFSTKKSDDPKNIFEDSGMGLGLSVCQKVIYDHGGEITLKSAPFKTTFSIVLPK